MAVADAQRDDADCLGQLPLIDPEASVNDSTLGAYTEVGPRTSLIEVRMDDYSYVVNDSEIIYADIGKFCSIAAHTRINPGNHPMERASQSHFTYRSSRYWPDAEDDTSFFDWRRKHKVTIGHDVWIGHGAIILPGVSIGLGSVVAAGAVVTKNVPTYMIVAGVPAKPVRRRFPETIEEAMREIAWWDWSHQQLRRALDDFRSMSAQEFVEKFAGRQALN